MQVTEGLDTDALLASGQLELHTSATTYLRDGTFAPDEMIAFWEDQAAAGAGAEHGFARVVGEMSWLERTPTARENVVRYETWADGFALRFHHAILCLYDVRRLGSGIMLELMRTHPKLLLGGLILENPHHRPASHRATA